MPSKNRIKYYIKDGYYHIYNRGVDKRTIFQDEQDYKVFLTYLKEYLSPPPDPASIKKTIVVCKGRSFLQLPKIIKNYYQEIELVAYCLMPNHFHLLIHTKSGRSMENFMRSLATRYSMYFNKKYKRVGTLFQGIYKAAHILEDNYLLHLTRYIHLNPSENSSNLTKAYSSYADFLGLRKTRWVKPDFILKFFDQASKDFAQKTNTYKDFVEKYMIDSTDILGKQALEESEEAG